MVQKHGMHRLPNGIIPTETKGNIAHTSAHAHVRQIFPNPARSLNKIYSVFSVLIHSRCHGENIQIENDVFGSEFYLIHQNIIGAFGDFNSSFVIVSLAHFIKSHYDYRGTVAFYEFCVMDKFCFAFF